MSRDSCYRRHPCAAIINLEQVIYLDHEYVFPPEIHLESANNTVRFDSLGVVESSTRVALISSRDREINQHLVIQ
jgi:hypothetical protein